MGGWRQGGTLAYKAVSIWGKAEAAYVIATWPTHADSSSQLCSSLGAAWLVQTLRAAESSGISNTLTSQGSM